MKRLRLLIVSCVLLVTMVGLIVGAGPAKALANTCGTWTVDSSPSPGTYNWLYGVAAHSSTDVWAVGTYANTNPLNIRQPLIEHWNGINWSQVPAPATGATDILQGVAAISKLE